MKKIIKKYFCEQQKALALKKERAFVPSSIEKANPYIKRISDDEIIEIKNSGADLVASPEVINDYSLSGIDQFNEYVMKFSSSNTSTAYKYIKQQSLFNEYNEVFRDFFQSIARDDFNYLNLVCEPYFANTINKSLDKIRKKGYFLELEDLRIQQNYEIVGWEVYKNLRINRYKNYELTSKPEITSYFNNKLNIAKFPKVDISIFDNNKPFIFAVTMKVKTPMKLSLFNQNLSLKLHGKEKKEEVSYLVRFETEFSFIDFLKIASNPNKEKRTRSTRITDFNYLMKGNPFINDEIASLMHKKI